MFRQWLPMKYLCLYFANTDSPSTPVSAHTILAYTPPPRFVVQKIYSKMHLISCTNTHRDITDLVNHGMLKIQKLEYLENET